MRASLSFVIVLSAFVIGACALTPPGAGGGQQGAGAKSGTNWDQVLAAAKVEGKLALLGSAGDALRDGVTLGFQKKYPEIQLEYQAVLAGNELGQKVLTPLQAGQHLTDVVLVSPGPIIQTFIPANAVEPLQDYLVGPSSGDPSKWLNGKYDYSDDSGMYSIVYGAYVKSPWMYNSDLATEKDFKSNKDLLDPKYKGKIVMRVPRVQTPAISVVSFWYVADGLGKDFVQQFFTTQTPTFNDDDRQMLDALVRGQYTIGIGISEVQANDFVARGLPLKYVRPDSLSEGSYTTPGTAAVSVIKGPPHPNAAKVYLDYFFSRDGQYEWSKAAGQVSARQDVPRDHLPDYSVPKPGVKYIEQQKESFFRSQEEVSKFIAPFIAR